jgi:hypothetical protein
MVADWLSAAFRCIERDPKHVKSISDTAHDLLIGKYNKNNEGPQEQQTQQQNTSSSSSTTVVAQEGNSRLQVQNELANRFLTNRNILIANEVSKIAKEIGCSAARTVNEQQSNKYPIWLPDALSDDLA